MGEYEAWLRKVFPALYGAAIEVCDDEEEAAWIAQAVLLESYGELLGEDRPMKTADAAYTTEVPQCPDPSAGIRPRFS